jgi:hypothetical protein
MKNKKDHRQSDEEPTLCVHYSDDCPLCEEQAAIAAESAKPVRWMPPFNENDCGGVFDGFGVVSDADPGL